MSYINERSWDHIVDEVSRKGEKLVQFVTECEDLYQKHSILWQRRARGGASEGQVNEELTKQLMKNRRGKNGDQLDAPASAAELEMLTDLKNALEAMHAIYAATDFEALRKFL